MPLKHLPLLCLLAGAHAGPLLRRAAQTNTVRSAEWVETPAQTNSVTSAEGVAAPYEASLEHTIVANA